MPRHGVDWVAGGYKRYSCMHTIAIHAYYIVHILHSTLLPISRVLTRLGTITTTAMCTYRSAAYPHGSPASRVLSRLGAAVTTATPILHARSERVRRLYHFKRTLHPAPMRSAVCALCCVGFGDASHGSPESRMRMSVRVVWYCNISFPGEASDQRAIHTIAVTGSMV